MNTVIYKQGIRYTEREYKKESEIEDLVVKNSKTLFGSNSIYVDAKKKITNNALGGVIPDGFLFDMTDPKNPEFYIVEVELSKHSFFNHIFPQITKFFAFFKNLDSQAKLIEKIYDIFENDEQLKKELKYKIGNKEIFKFIKDTIENSQSILIVIDKEKQEFPEIIETYTDTWGKMVRIAILKEYYQLEDEKDSIITMTPDFENIETMDIVSSDIADIISAPKYSIDFHLNGVSLEIKSLYDELQTRLFEKISSLAANPQRYYISFRKKRNFAFLKINRKKIAIVALMEEDKIRERIIHYNVESLSVGVQKFYNGPCARIDLTDNTYIDEVVELLLDIQK